MLTKLKLTIAAAVTATTLAACNPSEMLDSTAVDVAAETLLERVKSGDNKVHAVAMKFLAGYCKAPESVRLALRERYDNRVVIRCE